MSFERFPKNFDRNDLFKSNVLLENLRRITKRGLPGACQPDGQLTVAPKLIQFYIIFEKSFPIEYLAGKPLLFPRWEKRGACQLNIH